MLIRAVFCIKTAFGKFKKAVYFCYMPIKKPKENKLLKRNQRIRERYCYLSDIKGYKNEKILDELEEEWLPLKRQTIWLIISKTGFYKNL